jgi:hypothetical protein
VLQTECKHLCTVSMKGVWKCTCLGKVTEMNVTLMSMTKSGTEMLKGIMEVVEISTHKSSLHLMLQNGLP